MAVKVLWCLGALVIAAMLNPLPVESQCTAKHCYDDVEADVLKMLMFIQGSMERQEQQMASMKEELSLMKEEMSSMKDNLTVCLTKQDMRAYDCADLLRQGYTASGVYTIYIHGLTDTMEVYCDMETDGGGWLVFQRRQDGSVDFYRDWDSYKRGFGSLSGEFWLGNDKLHEITSQRQYTLRIDMEDLYIYTLTYAVYSTFRVGPESDDYRMTVGSYSGNAWDSLVYPHANQKFSTKDRDNDNSDENFAQLFKGAWWHNKIYTSNLNGLYPRNNTDYRLAGIVWHPGFNRSDFKKKASMKLRPTVHPGL